jgi:hypothetical protein
MALDVEPLAIEANQLRQGLVGLSRIARQEQDEPGLGDPGLVTSPVHRH